MATGKGAAEGSRGLKVIAGSYEHFLFGWKVPRTGSIDAEGIKSGGSQKVEKLFEYQSHVSVIRSIATNGILLATGSDDETVKLYNLKTNKEVAVLDHHIGSITCLSLYDNKYLLSSSLDGKISIIRLRDFALLESLEDHKHGVAWFDIQPSGAALLSVSNNLRLKVWDLSKTTCTYSMKLERPAKKVFWSQTGSNYYLVYEDGIEILDTESGQVVKELSFNRVSTALAAKVSLDPNQSSLTDVLVVSEPTGDITVYTAQGVRIGSWNANFRKRLKTIFATNHSSSGGSELIACSTDGLVKLWNLDATARTVSVSPGVEVPEHTIIESKSRLTCVTACSL